MWYVDDTKFSHKGANVVSDVITAIEDKFGKMTVSRGTKDSFLGMEIELWEDNTVTVKMAEYLASVISNFGEPIACTATSPATKALFEISDQLPLVSEGERDRFHSVVARLLYVCQRGQPDLQHTVPFLCTCLAKCTRQDWASCGSS